MRVTNIFRYILFLAVWGVFTFNHILLSQSVKVEIKGYIKDVNMKGIPGVIIYLKSSKDMILWSENKTITDGEGFYRFDNLDSGMSHLLTPFKSYFLFNPQTAKIVNLKQSIFQDFFQVVIDVKKYSISGNLKENNNIPVNDAKITLYVQSNSGTLNFSTNSDINGYYSFKDIDSGSSITVIPQKDLYIFMPKYSVDGVISENKTFNFTGAKMTASTFDISGYIKDNDSKPLSNAVVLLLGPPEKSSFSGRTITDSGGFYKFEKLSSGGYYTVLPSKEGYLFTPESKTYEVLDTDKKQNFIANKDNIKRYTVSGYIKDINSVGIEGVTIYLNSYYLSSISFKAITDANGFFKIENVKEGITYSISANKSGYYFEPNYLILEKLNENKTINFTGKSLPDAISISGYIKTKNSTGVPNVWVYISGPKLITFAPVKAITDNYGYYKTDKIPSGQMLIVTPIKEGYKFDPESKKNEMVLQDMLVDFTAIIDDSPNYSISGYIKTKNQLPLPNISVKIVRQSYESNIYSVITDQNGFYKFEKLKSSIPYSLYPVSENYQFDPATVFIESLKGDRVQSFTAIQMNDNLVISGYVKDSDSKPMDSAIVYLSGSKSSIMKCMTDRNGFYKFEKIYSGQTIKISAIKPDYYFDPVSVVWEFITENKTQNFTGKLISTAVKLYSLQGYVKTSNTLGLGGVEINIYKQSPVFIDYVETYKVTTDEKGYYEFNKILEGMTYLIIPVKQGYIFDPKSFTISNVAGNKSLDFKSIPITYFSISGYIKDNQGNGISGVNILSNIENKILISTDKNGFYSINNLEAGRYYNILPVKKGYKFDPQYRICEKLDSDKKYDFTGYSTSLTSNIICGFILGEDNRPLSNVSIVLRGDNDFIATTDINGFFAFENLEDGKNYEITPYKAGYKFSPPNLSFNNYDDSKVVNSNAVQISFSDVKQNENEILPDKFQLSQNYPNPFNPETNIQYSLPENSFVNLKIYDICGREVTTLINEMKPRGKHYISWHPRNLPSGLYLYKLQSGSSIELKKMLLLK